ncbi:MAG: formate--tetrahydrofolate ligase [Clostridia bacterium]|uniref:Formate--tetrahydrofolate ligase n=1 Tax=Thermacetogenium phaeum TaxID=85874 RepID=A0A117LBE4_9THEO|nr:MAG: Formate--tetrahydrofolate ligase [Thermacetogenium phaeum]MDK2881570.1 formate--tetrahydrofolate ligase [Clostridia bacterium]MDN5366550.1 formate--tetrahydrofolate ligase [Thermacetogenium sp.]MDN5376293.1 formate--tetrahydrofolate ligase [Thermacetogenium sp.]
MPFDPTKMKDWQIAEEAEKTMPTPEEWIDRLGLEKDELIPYGRTPRIDFIKVMNRLKDRPDGKYIEVTAITPTPLGEGKTTTTMGIMEGLGKRGQNVGGAIRQPSGGPTMNIKGTAAGGGNALLIPMTEFSLGLTGDINDITNAHNLAMVALNARMQHEANYDDEQLAQRGLRRLDIDPKNVEMGWVIDFAAQGLRNIIIGLGGKKDGFLMQSKFGITVSSELMAILAVAKDLADLRERLKHIVVAYDRKGNPITTADLEVDGAMCAWMRNTINPTLCCTVEHQPCFVHAGPFANIAIGQSSIIADRLGLKLFDYHVTESGFAADIGFEKFWNVKCRLSGLKPNVSILVATVRALKMHGGGPTVVPGRPIPEEYTKENLALLEKGCENLVHMINVVKKSGIKPVVCINSFYTDTPAEQALVKRVAEQAGARAAVSEHWLKGGEGALELADAVMDACKEEVDFKYLYPLEMPLRQRVELIAKEVYGADGVDWAPLAEEKAKKFESDPKYAEYATMMVKTHLSLSHEPTWKGVPKNWRLPIRDILVYGGAKFLCPMAGAISLMPGTSSDPAFRRIDVDVNTGKVMGLF